VIHQTFKTDLIPQRWLSAQQSCRDLHHDNWTHRFWTDEDADAFLTTHYPWFLERYRSYPYDIQRVDVLRYFILYHFGGVYLDLDIGCKKDLTALLRYDAVLPETNAIGVSNDVMMAIPRHPFFLQVINSLSAGSGFWGPKYTTVLFSTGPMFLTAQLQEFRRRQARDQTDTHLDYHTPSFCYNTTGLSIIPNELYASGAKSFFRHYQGSSWHGVDAHFIQWVLNHKVLIAVVVLLGLAIWHCGGMARRLYLRRVQWIESPILVRSKLDR
jgi:mannosyltransferase OCH1-like enzyme